MYQHNLCNMHGFHRSLVSVMPRETEHTMKDGENILLGHKLQGKREWWKKNKMIKKRQKCLVRLFYGLTWFS